MDVSIVSQPPTAPSVLPRRGALTLSSSPSVSPSATPRQAMQEVVLTSSVLAAASALIMTILIVLELIGIWQSRVPVTKPSRRWLIPLTLGTMFALPLVIMVGLLTWIDWHGKEVACEILPFAITNVYVLSKQLYSAFLFARAKLVHDALRITSRRLILLRRAMFFNAAVLPIFAFGAENFFFFKGKVVAEGNCIFYSTEPIIIIAFSVLDALMGLGLLGLFVVPLNRHTRHMAGVRQPVDAGLRRMIRFNLRLSLFVIVFDVLCLGSLAFCLLFVLGKEVDPSLEHIQVWGMVFAIVSSTVYVLTAHAFTTAWIPVKVKHAIRRFSTKRASLKEEMFPPPPADANDVTNLRQQQQQQQQQKLFTIHAIQDFNTRPAYMMTDDEEELKAKHPALVMSTGNSVVTAGTPPESAHSLSETHSRMEDSQHSTVAGDSFADDGEEELGVTAATTASPSSYEEKKRSIRADDWGIV